MVWLGIISLSLIPGLITYLLATQLNKSVEKR